MFALFGESNLSRTLTVKIKELDNKGLGVAEFEGIKLRVSYVLPGEIVKVYFPKRTKRPVRPLKILSKSPHRVKPLCPYFGICGGCIWQHIDYSYQLELKQERVRALFATLGVREINQIIEADKLWRYRNKMEFAFGGTIQSIKIGLKMLGRFDKIINLDTCLIQREIGDKILQIIRNHVNEKKLDPYDNVSHKGFLRFIVIRTSFNLNEVMVNLVTTTWGSLNLNELQDALNVQSLLWSVTNDLADVAMGEIKEVIGRKYITEKLLGLYFRIYPYSFFQTNPLQAEKAFKLMKSLISEGKRALDLYSGVGTIGLIMADIYDEIIGIEVNKEAVSAAKENAGINGIGNINFIQGSVEDKIGSFATRDIDTIFIDPPRAGIHRKVLAGIMRILPRKIVYLSCNPQTQVNDIRYLARKYDIEYVQPIDFFPHTPHIENLVILTKK